MAFIPYAGGTFYTRSPGEKGRGKRREKEKRKKKGKEEEKRRRSHNAINCHHNSLHALWKAWQDAKMNDSGDSRISLVSERGMECGCVM